MSDFLIHFDPAIGPADLVALLQQPYGDRAPGGKGFRHPWGAWAVLDDPVARGLNTLAVAGGTFAWVGDLVFPEGRDGLRGCLEAEWPAERRALTVDDCVRLLQRGTLVPRLNGAMAAVIAADDFLCVITDPMAAVQVYVGTDESGRTLAVGTHPDLVARCLGDDERLDPVSICDFLNTGTPCCPHTMHRGVTEMTAGAVRLFRFGPGGAREEREFRHWTPPDALTADAEMEELAAEFTRRWKRAVVRRCEGSRLGVTLSGGMDSRVVLAEIPLEKSCVALTLCDEINREARIARRVARCYGREWVTLRRDPEYVAATAIAATRFTGCEGEWHHAHTIGFAERFAEMGLDSVFTGLYMDNNFKAYYGRDLKRVPRLGNLLPPVYRARPLDYINRINDLCRRHVRDELVRACVDRRRCFYEASFARRRESEWEWLDGYPLTQASDNTGWIVERRVMPLRLPVMDREMVDLAFLIPARLKAGGQLYLRAAAMLLGPGARIPNANDGVRPGSGHFSRLAQRALRKMETTGRQLAARAGLQLGVPHSWHDYQSYWRESPALHRLIAEHAANLQSLESTVFKSATAPLFEQKDLPWRVGLRLVQLAVWRSILAGYRLKRPSRGVAVQNSARTGTPPLHEWTAG
ncbi:MAG TPA: asparagine synthase-related protein [Methylomirabilota bacterium]|nr:asparagine synthase-related protein [Methylomirabilota bacterium]